MKTTLSASEFFTRIKRVYDNNTEVMSCTLYHESDGQHIIEAWADDADPDILGYLSGSCNTDYTIEIHHDDTFELDGTVVTQVRKNGSVNMFHLLKTTECKVEEILQ